MTFAALLSFRSRFVFGTEELIMSLPISPWTRSLRGIGGNIESDAAVMAGFVVRRDQLLNFTLRFFEDEWAAVQHFIDYAQTGAPFTWYPDVDDETQLFLVTLDSPSAGDTYFATRDATYPRMQTLSITILQVAGGPWVLEPWDAPPPDPEAPPEPAAEVVTAETGMTVSGTFGLLAVGGGSGGSGGNGGGGGRVAFQIFTTAGVLTIINGVGGISGSPTSQSGTGTFVQLAGQPDLEALGGGPAGGFFGGSSSGGGGGGVAGIGSGLGSAGGGGGGAGALQPGADSVASSSPALFAAAGKGGDGFPIFYKGELIGVFGGGGGGTATYEGSGFAVAGAGGAGGGGTGGTNSGGFPGTDGLGGGGGGGASGGDGAAYIIFTTGEATIS